MSVGNGSDYGTFLFNRTEENNRDASEFTYDAEMKKFVDSFGCKLTKEGNEWCCLFGENLQSGHGEFGKSPRSAVAGMASFLMNENYKE